MNNGRILILKKLTYLRSWDQVDADTRLWVSSYRWCKKWESDVWLGLIELRRLLGLCGGTLSRFQLQICFGRWKYDMMRALKSALLALLLDHGALCQTLTFNIINSILFEENTAEQLQHVAFCYFITVWETHTRGGNYRGLVAHLCKPSSSSSRLFSVTIRTVTISSIEAVPYQNMYDHLL